MQVRPAPLFSGAINKHRSMQEGFVQLVHSTKQTICLIKPQSKLFSVPDCQNTLCWVFQNKPAARVPF